MIFFLYGSVLGLDQNMILIVSIVECLIETVVLTVLANRYFIRTPD